MGGDIIQVLIILGIIGFGIIRQVMKANAQNAENQAPPVYMPDEQEEEITVQQFKARQKDTLHTPKPREALKSHLQETEDVTQEFDIHSAEEIRRGIIWSEILNRKY